MKTDPTFACVIDGKRPPRQEHRPPDIWIGKRFERRSNEVSELVKHERFFTINVPNSKSCRLVTVFHPPSRRPAV